MGGYWEIGVLLLGCVLMGNACKYSCVYKQQCSVEAPKFNYRQSDCIAPQICCAIQLENAFNPVPKDPGVSGYPGSPQTGVQPSASGQNPWPVNQSGQGAAAQPSEYGDPPRGSAGNNLNQERRDFQDAAQPSGYGNQPGGYPGSTQTGVRPSAPSKNSWQAGNVGQGSAGNNLNQERRDFKTEGAVNLNQGRKDIPVYSGYPGHVQTVVKPTAPTQNQYAEGNVGQGAAAPPSGYGDQPRGSAGNNLNQERRDFQDAAQPSGYGDQPRGSGQTGVRPNAPAQNTWPVSQGGQGAAAQPSGYGSAGYGDQTREPTQTGVRPSPPSQTPWQGGNGVLGAAAQPKGHGDQPKGPTQTQRPANKPIGHGNQPTPAAGANGHNGAGQTQHCGISNANGLGNYKSITKDQARPAEFPWVVALVSHSIYLAGGSLIRPSVVLTVAHVLINQTEDDLVVRAGEWNTATEEESFQFEERLVGKIKRHEGYDFYTGSNNLALLLLKSAFPMKDHIGTICLPTPSPFVPRRCIVAGWGKLNYQSEDYSTILKKVEVPLVDRARCQQQLRSTSLGHDFELPQSLICAGGELNNDACTGDGGSALFCPVGEPDSGLYEQVGIVNWGMECGRKDVPATYTDVAMFRHWIDQKLLPFQYRSSERPLHQ
ncbi:probable threonine protease PRSS50 [Drosophila rhopaloa]|uniref:Peptidase S1 domain-containing protein n=1 Tax=Drosophila rhopaloa TaxID=1041015 RepID=A0ABM5HYL8_DRORH|nr:probable threonine protease PRSS50 [Drosophila rhopaloa]